MNVKVELVKKVQKNTKICRNNAVDCCKNGQGRNVDDTQNMIESITLDNCRWLHMLESNPPVSVYRLRNKEGIAEVVRVYVDHKSTTPPAVFSPISETLRKSSLP